MNKAELESKHLSDLHSLAAAAGVERFRMLSRAELIEKLSDGGGNGGGGGGDSRRGERAERPQRERSRRRRGGGGGESGGEGSGGSEKPKSERPKAQKREKRDRDTGRREEKKPAAEEKPAPPEQAPSQRQEPAAEPNRPRRRRRRRFGRRNKDAVTIQSLLLPPEPGRQTILYADSREACTALLRGVAADLSADSKGPDPVALLIDPSPEELADWKREAPQAEIVSAGQPRHADDALAQAGNRAGGGEDVMLLVDSLTRLAAAHGDADAAKRFFDAGRAQGAGNGSLTIVAALEKPA